MCGSFGAKWCLIFYMGRFIGRLALLALGVAILSTLGLLLALWSLNRQEVRIAQTMMEDAGRLQVGKSTLNDVFAYARKFNWEATGSSHEMPCTESDCLVTADPRKNDFLERHPKLRSFALHVSRRYWNFVTLMWVKDGRLTGVEEWFTFMTPSTSAAVITDTGQPSLSLCRNPFFRLHHTFVAYEAAKHFAVWVDSTATREKEILRLNLECASSLRGCRDIARMAPAAWAKYESDRAVVNSDSWLRAAQDDNCRSKPFTRPSEAGHTSRHN